MRARDNPFRTERLLQVRYRLEGITWAELLARCEALGYRAALIGPHGSGKTTLLEDLEPRLRERGFGTHFLRLDAEHRSFSPGVIESLSARLTPRDLLLLDGAEQLNPLAWRWFRWQTRKAAGLIITTHQAGRLPTLWACHTSPELLATLAAQLLTVEPATLRDQAAALFAKHRGNLREALREWYDLLAQSTTGSAGILPASVSGSAGILPACLAAHPLAGRMPALPVKRAPSGVSVRMRPQQFP